MDAVRCGEFGQGKVRSGLERRGRVGHGEVRGISR